MRAAVPDPRTAAALAAAAVARRRGRDLLQLRLHERAGGAVLAAAARARCRRSSSTSIRPPPSARRSRARSRGSTSTPGRSRRSGATAAATSTTTTRARPHGLHRPLDQHHRLPAAARAARLAEVPRRRRARAARPDAVRRTGRARIVERGSQEECVVDTWFLDPGLPGTVFPLKAWLDGAEPPGCRDSPHLGAVSERIVVGMSGGVDSSVAALLLKRQGFEVVGLFMKNWEDDDDDEYCSTRQDLIDCASVADVIGIELEVVNFAAEYKERVFASFLAEYSAGPHAQPRRAVQRRDQVQGLPRPRDGARRGAHRHRPLRAACASGAGRFELLKARDPTKDQSYFLHRLTQAQLARVVFPLGAPGEDRSAPHRPRGGPAGARQEGLDRHLLHRRAAVPRVPQPLPAAHARRRCARPRAGSSASTSASRSTPSARGRASASAA